MGEPLSFFCERSAPLTRALHFPLQSLYIPPTFSHHPDRQQTRSLVLGSRKPFGSSVETESKCSAWLQRRERVRYACNEEGRDWSSGLVCSCIWRSRNCKREILFYRAVLELTASRIYPFVAISRQVTTSSDRNLPVHF